MDEQGRYGAEDFLRFRGYLRFLAEVGLDPRLARTLDPSDVVQTVFLKACQARGQLRARSDAGVAGWLRQILRNTLATALGDLLRERQRLGVRLPMEEVIEQSSMRLREVLRDRGPSPSSRAEEEELTLKLVAAVERLPQNQRDVLILQRWHRWSVAEIAAHVGRSESAVTGLLRRGLHRLRRELKELR